MAKNYASIKKQMDEMLEKLAALISEKKHKFGSGYAHFYKTAKENKK